MASSNMTIRLFLILLLLSVDPLLVFTQSKQPTTDEIKNSEVVHWASVLNRIAVEAKTLQDETSRPEAVVAVADAFWLLDNKKSRELLPAIQSSSPSNPDMNLTSGPRPSPVRFRF